MKKTSLLTSAFVAALAFFLFPTTSLTAHAKNYAVSFNEEKQEWKWQEGSTYDSSKEENHMYYLSLQDGDYVAVYEGAASDGETLDLGSAKLGNLTIVNTIGTVVVKTGGISECYILANTTSSISGNVNTAYVYDPATVTFTGNVTNLISTSNNSDYNCNIGVGGTVAYYHAYSLNDPKTFWEKYNFAAGKFSVEDGNLKTQYYYYDDNGTVPTSTTTDTAAAAESSTTTTAAPSTTTAVASASEYDDVPKTGEDASYAYLLLLAAAVCGAGSVMLRKRV